MKTIGLLGGMSWESTLNYYKLLNEGIRDRLGGFHSAKIIMYSVDFHQMQTLQRDGKWDEAGKVLADYAFKLQEAGADYIFICTNTMHKVAPIIEKRINIPLIHVAQATTEALQKEKCKKTILLGTRFTMQEDFNKKIIEKGDIQVVVPDIEDIEIIDNIIFDELVVGKVLQSSKQKYLNIIKKLCLKNEDIDSVILGCTEIGLLLNQGDTKLKVFDTTNLHVNKALEIAIED
jgi:aspartate racemase